MYTIKINCRGRNTREGKQRMSVEKIIVGLKIKVKKEKRKKRKENSTELQKPNIEAEVYNNNKKCD